MSVGDWIMTFSGRVFFPLNPQPADIVIEDIARPLAHTCRWGGQCLQYYSVAQHAVICSHVFDKLCAASGVVPAPMDRLYMLHHDSQEAYLGDVPAPIKRMLHFLWKSEQSDMLFEEYNRAELGVARAVMAGLTGDNRAPFIKSRLMHEVDMRVCRTELEQLMDVETFRQRYPDIIIGLDAYEPLPLDIIPAAPDDAYTMFMARHHELIDALKESRDGLTHTPT